ncbi:hypothetical protein SPRG_12799 [Saprolegnia parasitica CBS 223.65]|uniref:No apical meristem-associated C-terminal domain-containing protein n=1 Tax=Saprolegnia parasitica (strain CBS 223.65) TaxID=695850 RepID=A0A067BVP2_SAPPC|nr:hypothetical protein SPRG_12799 [Saprolegnia parasitica CBS 223.65]KDO22338.1 hypothetical protein SPRG_12799 [Saprolegnia parasitica CBS 223.65]|eukprot:XP_012206972.1 hypothetical protein SPRG_12799 [Saprolegnia parasitica CBS 223.65]
MPRGVAWSKEDDLELCHAWLAICSEDTSSRRRPPELFARMHEYIVERSNRPTQRSAVALLSRWKKISAILSLLDAAVARAIAVKSPNVVDDIVILDELAAIPVEKLGAVDRRGVLACWRLLRNTPAWCRFLRLPREPATDDDANDHTEEAPAKRAKRSPDATPPRTSFLTISEASNTHASPTSEPTVESAQSSNTSSEVPNTSSELPAVSSTEPAASSTEPPALSEDPSTTPPPAAVSAPATTSERSASPATAISEPPVTTISEPPAAVYEAPGRNRPAAARFREVGHRIPRGAYSLAPHPPVPQAPFRPPETVYRHPETVYRHPDAALRGPEATYHGPAPSTRFEPGTRHVGVGAHPMGPRSLPPDVVRYQEGTSPPSLWPNAEWSPWPTRGSVTTPSTEMHVRVLSERNQLDEWTFMARVFEHDPDAPDAIEFRRLLRSSMLQRARQLHANGNSFLDPRSTNDGNVHV